MFTFDADLGDFAQLDPIHQLSGSSTVVPLQAPITVSEEPLFVAFALVFHL